MPPLRVSSLSAVAACGACVQRKLKNQYIPLRTNLPWVAVELDDLVTAHLNADRARRPATIEEFSVALRKIVNSHDFNGANLDLAPGALESRLVGIRR